MNKIGLIDVDGRKFPNLPLMKISNYHKQNGDSVEWLINFNEYDIAYVSKIFDFTKEDRHYINAERIHKGGTGFDLKTKLPDEIEFSQPDYSIYPNHKFSIQLFSRGCIRKCKFCVVPEKEGKLISIEPMNLNPNGKYIEILDNNFFANPEWKEAIGWLFKWNQPVNFNGVDICILNEDQAYWLNKLKIKKKIYIAWDSPDQDLTKKIKEITKYIKPYKFTCYVLIGFDSTPEQDLFRIEKLRKLNIDSFVMPFNKSDPYQKRFARWVNHKATFNTVSFDKYKY